jgi:quercetin dioxygenase-like cupin family protein
VSFTQRDEVRQEQFDWGVIGWRLTPRTGASQLVAMDVTLAPGGGHAFHRHPGQEEMILVVEGRITQFLEQESRVLEVGDSVFVPPGAVHASFNDGDQMARLTVVIGPALDTETGYGTEEVADQEPWASLRS